MAWWSRIVSAISTLANVPALVRLGSGAFGVLLMLLAILLGNMTLFAVGGIVAAVAVFWPSKRES